MKTDDIRTLLLSMADNPYAAFQRKLIPTVTPDRLIGIRTPQLRQLAKELSRNEDMSTFLTDLPHRYFEENQLHAFILSGMKNFSACLDATTHFLPFIDNWATCDQLSPRVFRKDKVALLAKVTSWLGAQHEYTVRFAIRMLMDHFLDDDFSTDYPALVASVRRNEYYVRMMQAWYFATALAKQYEAVLGFIENRSLDTWTHNKTIQKAIESFRISDEQKAFLRTFKIL